MGGYAAFVWSAYGLATVVLTGLLAHSLISMRAREALVESLRERRNQRLADDDPSAGKQT